MKKNSDTSKNNLGSFLSPGAPNYTEKSNGSQKGWSSERVLEQASSRRRTSSVVVSAGLTPFSSGRTMPSKWDDAERWICSPVLGYVNNNNNKVSSSLCAQAQRRPKSKSGPIVPRGTGYSYSNYSPTIPLHQGLVVRNLMVGSPFTTGVLAPDALSVHHFDSHDAVFGNRFDIGNVMQCSGAVLSDSGVALSSVSSAPTWSELLCEPSSPNSQDESCDGTKNEDSPIISHLSTRDQGTQMSPPDTENDAISSPKSSPASTIDQKKGHSTKLEIRDVQVDSQATVIRRSKRNGTKRSSSHSKEDLKETSTEARGSCLEIPESTLDKTKIQREEAKIAAWESLQKAKAEAAIRKLEMKLEKKRSWTMDKIVNKLRRAQMKAEKMRSSIYVEQGKQGSSSKTRKVFSLPKYIQIWSPSRCFSSNAP